MNMNPILDRLTVAGRPGTAAVLLAVTWLAVWGGQSPVFAGTQDAVDGCIDRIREVGGPDAQNSGEVLSTEWSQAGTLVRLRDAGGTVWECIGYDDGTVGDLKVVDAADDGEGAMAGAASTEPTTVTERVRFAAGTSGTEIFDSLTPGSTIRYVLGARDGQFLYVGVAPQGPDVYYQIFNPDGSFLLDQISSDLDYRGQLWQSGDHVVEVINRGVGTTSYSIIIGIDG